MENESQDLKDRRPSFCKIIPPLPGTSQLLRIPPHFIKDVLKEAFESATLKGPSGCCWPVKLCKNAEGTFLMDGWHQFFKAHSLGHFEFLLFLYDGKMCFEVRIYDKNGWERVEVPVTFPHQNDDSHESVSFEHVSGPRLQCHESNQSKKSSQKKRSRVEMEKEVVELSDEELGFQFKKFEDVKLDQSKVPEVAIDHPSSSTKSPPTEVRNGIYGENDTFRSTFPFFQRCLDQYGLKVLRIPLAFAEKYLSSVGTRMTLRNEEGNCWEVKFTPKGRRADRPRFSRGWLQFVRDNELKLGDLCVFELLNTMQIQAYIVPSS